MVPGHRISKGRTVTAGGGIAVIGELLARCLLAAFAELTLLVYRLLRRLTRLSNRRAEYLADALAAAVGGTTATSELLQALTLGSAVGFVRQRLRVTNGGPTDFLALLREYVASIPESERARRLRVSELDESATDTAHPPTYLRLAFVRQLASGDAAITVTTAELTAIEAELMPARAAIAARLS